jgi:uncharacterized membrane protein
MSSENSTIIAFLFSKTKISNEVYESIHRLHNGGAMEVLDVCEFAVKDNGKIKFEQAMTLPLIGSGDEIFLEAFVGLIFFNAPHNDNVARAIRELHLENEFIHSVTEAAVPGSTVLFVHVKDQPDRTLLQNLAPQADRIVTIPLTLEQITKLEILFHGKQISDPAFADVSIH